MKRKVSDRVDRNDSTEKEKSPGTRLHGKEKWVPVPYVPSAIFATPLPTGARRGGRGGGRGGREGGGRGGHASSNSIGGDKAGAGSTGPPPAPKSTSNERGRNEGSGSRATSLPAQSRRANSADAAPATDLRKTSQPVQQERSRGEARPSRNAEDLVPKSADSARFPNNVSEENGPKFRQESRTFSRANEGSNNGSNQRTYDPSMRHPSLPNSNDIHAHPRYEDGGRRSSSFIRPSDFQREPRESNSGIYPRERGEPRTERGRGGYRGPRGNFNGGNSQPRDSFSNAPQPQQTPPSFTPSKSHSYNDRPSYTDRGSQQPQSSSYSGVSQQPRPQRPNLRTQSIPTSGGYQQYPSPNGAQVAQIQTDVPPTYVYPPMYAGIMSAMPYQPYMADYSVMSMVQMQMDYYFSVDNLCKDLYLRKHMDSQGFVPLHVIANFRRIKSLTDNLEVLRMVCRSLKSLELRAGEDGIDRVRKREGWDQWILKMEDRDPSAQNDGPAEIFHQQHPQSPQGYVDGPDDVFSPAELHNSRVGAGIAMSPTSMQGPFPEYPAPIIPTSPFEYMNGMMQTPLSHATPEFVPNFPPLSLNDVAARDAVPLQSFPEELVDDIMMVVKRQPGQVSSPSHQPNPVGRTLPKESISDRAMEQNGSSGDGRQGLSLRGDNVGSNL
jgi:la-related protein 1